MDVRPATSTDRSGIGDIARASFESSYSLSPQAIEAILEDVFSADALEARIDDPDVQFLIAEDEVEGESGVQGFIDVVLGDDPTVRWLHVHPNARGRGIATALFEEARSSLEEDSQPLEARVLADAAEGGEFFEQFGLQESGTGTSEFGGEEYSVTLFTEGSGTEQSNEPTVPVPETVEAGGAERFLGREEDISGTEAPFFHLYADRDRDEPYGYFCSQCASTDVSADGLDRLVCNECGNQHDAEEWDSAFL